MLGAVHFRDCLVQIRIEPLANRLDFLNAEALQGAHQEALGGTDAFDQGRILDRLRRSALDGVDRAVQIVRDHQ